MVTDKQRLGTAELLFQCARKMGLMPVWVTPLGTFVIRFGGQERYINLACSYINSAASAGLAKDKNLTRRILERHSIPNIPFTLPRSHVEAERFLAQHKKIIAKPVTGAGAHDIHIVTDRSQLEALRITDYILEEYISGKEMRYLVLNDRVIGVHRSEYGTSVAEDRALRRISYPRALWKSALVESSLRIAKLLHLKFATVDYLVDASGKAHILEVNTMPGLKWFHAPSSGPAVDVARLFLESILDELGDQSPPVSGKVVARPMVTYTER